MFRLLASISLLLIATGHYSSFANTECEYCKNPNAMAAKYLGIESPTRPPENPNKPPEPQVPPLAGGGSSNNTGRSPSSGSARTTPDTRGLGSYYYDLAGGGAPLPPRERRMADEYKQETLNLRNQPVSWQNAGLDAAQNRQLEQSLNSLGVKYDKKTNSIIPSNNKTQDLAVDDRVRKILNDEIRPPFENMNQKLDVVMAKLKELEGRLHEKEAPPMVGFNFKKPKRSRKGVDPADRTIASLPNIAPHKAAEDPMDLDQIINSALYIKDIRNWRKIKSLTPKQSKDHYTNKVYSKDIYKSLTADGQNEIRVLELIKNDEVAAMKVFVYQVDKRAWLPVFYKFDNNTNTFVRQSTYHDQKLPFACLNCHGDTPRRLSPVVKISNWPKQ